MNPQRAQRLIKRCIGEAVSKGYVMSPPDTAKHWALFILLEDGKFEAMVAKLTAADLSTWTKSRLTAVEIEARSAQRSLPGSFPVWCAVIEGEDVYADVTEVRVDPLGNQTDGPAARGPQSA
ncbi:MAG TPA: hypothetical protein PKI03_07795 [Pseudomonadota bacterium]|nr:hypothetical protein [Pseudomonadota bacterium]